MLYASLFILLTNAREQYSWGRTSSRLNFLNVSLVTSINKSFEKSLDSKFICQVCKFGQSSQTYIKIYQHGEIEYGV